MAEPCAEGKSGEFITGYLKSNRYEEAFHMGICTGSASAFSERLATQAEVDGILEQMGWK